ncbi:CCA tRNA nucleotidyltransferase [Candidatus Woesearchaeota archaeon]|nr:CCA tRNA nucleotidyltransferase [Candidatus Woesearchaeota archaeon]
MVKFLLKEALEEIKPSIEYKKEILGKADEIIKKINRGLKNANAVLGGSGAKGTWLKTFDADIFVKFDYNKFKDKDDKLADILEKFLKRHFKIERLHGSRDYFQIRKENFTFEIIPILRIKKAEQAKNITDISPLHSDFVLKHKNLTNEIRLTKQFFRAANVYGAESYIRGFSGYVCELLTIYYSSFLDCIKAASKWKEKEVIDIKRYYKNKDIFAEMNLSKLTSPLIVIDPVQKERNAAAALSYEKFSLLKSKAKEFLKKPSRDFFEQHVLTKSELAKKYKNILFFEVTPLKRKEDVAGAKMLKSFNFIKKDLIDNGFEAIDANMVWDKKGNAFFYYALKDMEISKTFEMNGPPLKIKMHASLFRKKHKNTFIRDKRIFAVEKRKFSNAGDLAKNSISSPNITNNVNQIRLI